jgi:uncharacterized damage-inducible protein DinB
MLDGATEEDMTSSFEYATTDGKRFRDQRSTIIGHVFNHATHHRGQVRLFASERVSVIVTASLYLNQSGTH